MMDTIGLLQMPSTVIAVVIQQLNCRDALRLSLVNKRLNHLGHIILSTINQWKAPLTRGFLGVVDVEFSEQERERFTKILEENSNKINFSKIPQIFEDRFNAFAIYQTTGNNFTLRKKNVEEYPPCEQTKHLNWKQIGRLASIEQKIVLRFQKACQWNNSDKCYALAKKYPEVLVLIQNESWLLELIHQATYEIFNFLSSRGVYNGNKEVPFNQLLSYDQKKNSPCSTIKHLLLHLNAGTPKEHSLHEMNKNQVNTDLNPFEDLHLLVEAIQKKEKIDSVIEFIEKSKIPLNTLEFEGKTLLLIAINTHNTPVAMKLIQQKINLNFQTKKGESALLLAVLKKNLFLVTQLMACGANPNISHPLAAPPLFIAIDHQLNTIAGLFIAHKKINLNVRWIPLNKKQIYSPFLLALENKNFLMAKKLLEGNCDLSFYSDKSPLQILLENGQKKLALKVIEMTTNTKTGGRFSIKDLFHSVKYKQEKIFEILLKWFQENDLHSYKKSYSDLFLLISYVLPFSFSSKLIEDRYFVREVFEDPKIALLARLADEGHALIVQELIKKEIPLDISYPPSKKTAIHYAVEDGDVKLFNALYSRGACISLKSSTGETPLTLALLNWNRKDLYHFRYLEIAFILIQDKRIRPQLKAQSACELLLIAIQSKNLQAILFLLQHRIALNGYDRSGTTVLIFVLKQLTLEPLCIVLNKIADLLIQHEEIDLNLSDSSGNTPFHHAVREGLQEIAFKLLKQGVDPNSSDAYNVTPLISSIKWNRMEILHGLLAHEKLLIQERDWKNFSALMHAILLKKPEIVVSLIENRAIINLEDFERIQTLNFGTIWGFEFETFKKLDCKEWNPIFTKLMEIVRKVNRPLLLEYLYTQSIEDFLSFVVPEDEKEEINYSITHQVHAYFIRFNFEGKLESVLMDTYNISKLSKVIISGIDYLLKRGYRTAALKMTLLGLQICLSFHQSDFKERLKRI